MRVLNVCLYGTAGCHLCEQAMAMIVSLLPNYHIHLTEIDISDDDEMIAKYGTLIPVLGSPDNDSALNWPFSREEIVSYLSVLKSY